jgi:hypothetical protein
MDYKKDKDLVYLHRLCMNIRNGRFNWERYSNNGYYFGKEIATMPVFCSYGMIGFSVSFPYQSMPEVTYDWEMRELTIDDMDWKEYFSCEDERQLDGG